MANYSITYEIITEESEEGDAAERGYILEDTNDLREAISKLYSTRTNAVDGISAQEGGPNYITVVNGMEYETGAYESRTLHLENVTDASQRRLARLLDISYY